MEFQIGVNICLIPFGNTKVVLTAVIRHLLPLLANPANKVNVIVQYNTTTTQQQSCSTGGGLLGLVGGVVCTVVNLTGGILFTLINAVTGTLQAGDVIALSDQPNVTYISLDRAVNATLDYTADAVNAPFSWNSGLDGTGIGVAIIDSGIYPHPDLSSAWGRSRVVYRQSFIGGGVQYDDYGHGTHVAGIAAGNGRMSSMPGSLHLLRGIAPNAHLLDLRVLDNKSASTDSAVIAAIQQAVELKSKYNVRLSIADGIFPRWLDAESSPRRQNKVVIVTFGGGVRYSETFAPEGVRNIPRLLELKPEGFFYRNCVNSGVLSHFNSTASIVTGNWQRVDDFGFQPPASPTLFELYRKQRPARCGRRLGHRHE